MAIIDYRSYSDESVGSLLDLQPTVKSLRKEFFGGVVLFRVQEDCIVFLIIY